MSLILKWDYNAVPTVPEPMAPLLHGWPFSNLTICPRYMEVIDEWEEGEKLAEDFVWIPSSTKYPMGGSYDDGKLIDPVTGHIFTGHSFGGDLYEPPSSWWEAHEFRGDLVDTLISYGVIKSHHVIYEVVEELEGKGESRYLSKNLADAMDCYAEYGGSPGDDEREVSKKLFRRVYLGTISTRKKDEEPIYTQSLEWHRDDEEGHPYGVCERFGIPDIDDFRDEVKSRIEDSGETTITTTIPEAVKEHLLQVFPEMGYSMPRDWRRVRAIIERVMDEEVKDES